MPGEGRGPVIAGVAALATVGAVLLVVLLAGADRRRQGRPWQASMAKAGAGRGRDLVRNAGRTFKEITADEAALSTLVQRSSELFGELSRRRDALVDSIRIFPAFLDETKLTLARLRTFSVDTAPLISAGDEGLPALSRILRGLDATLAATGPLLQQVNPLLRYLEYSAYVQPNARRGPRALVLPSFDCNRSGEKGPTNAPGCAVQRPFGFAGQSGRFPHVEPAQPDGRLSSSGG